VVEGNKELAAAFLAERNDRHDIRNIVQANVSKVYELDGEVKLLKGVMVTLVGDGTGSSGMVPRLERDLKTVGEDVANLASDVREVNGKVDALTDGMRKLVQNSEKSQGFMSGFTGAKVALGIIASIVAILAFLLGRGFHL
jgi:hypothetical protein